MSKAKSIMLSALLSACNFGKISAQSFDFLLKLPYNFNSKSILAEPTATYTLPGKIEGFTFVDLYRQGYFGQTDLTKRIKNKETNCINARSRTLHINELHTATGLGINKDVSLFKERLYLSASILPIWFNNDGNAKRQTFDYFFDFKLGKKWSINCFGEWERKDKKINWVYGELDFGRTNNNKRFSYSPMINKKQGEKGIYLEHRLAFSYSFK